MPRSRYTSRPIRLKKTYNRPQLREIDFHYRSQGRPNLIEIKMGKTKRHTPTMPGKRPGKKGC